MRMRTFTFAALIALAACASQRDVVPREYLDETTAATITVMAKPWVFVEAPTSAASGARDFLNVYAIDVNRSGEHRQYLAVLEWWPRIGTQNTQEAKTLTLVVGDRDVSLHAASDDSRTLGIAQPLDRGAPAGSQWHYFPVDKQLLQDLSIAQISNVTLANRDAMTQYTTWKEARAEAAAFTTTLR